MRTDVFSALSLHLSFKFHSTIFLIYTHIKYITGTGH